jgi:hypothetical protein
MQVPPQGDFRSGRDEGWMHSLIALHKDEIVYCSPIVSSASPEKIQPRNNVMQSSTLSINRVFLRDFLSAHRMSLLLRKFLNKFGSRTEYGEALYGGQINC